MELQMCQQQIGNHRDPELRENRVERAAEEALDLQVLLDPLEKQLDLPALSVDLGNGAGGGFEVVGDKDQVFSGRRISIADAAQDQAQGASLPAVQNDGLVRGNVVLPGHILAFPDGVAGAPLQPGNEAYVLLRQRLPPTIVSEPSIKNDDTSSRKLEGTSPLHFLPSSFADMDEGRQVSAVIQADVELDGTLLSLVSRPREQRQGQVDQGSVERIEFGLEASTMVRSCRLTSAQESFENSLKERMRLFLVDSREAGTGDRQRSKVIELAALSP